MPERDAVKNKNNHRRRRDGLYNTHPEITTPSTTTDLVLQWGSRKRLRCMKIQVKDDSTGPDLHKTTVRVNRRVVRTDKDCSGHSKDNGDNDHHRLLRNSETWRAMKGQNNGLRSSSSPERGGWEGRKGNNDQNKVAGTSGSSETAEDSKKGGSSSGSEEVPVWPPNLVIALSNKEKEEDFMAIKGCKLPQRPKKRAKFMQRTINLVSPGGWLCDLTLERYEVREKKTSKKRPRGLKAMGNVDGDSE